MTNKEIDFKCVSGADFQCIVYGAMGFSARHIGKKLGFSSSQVYYRMKKAHLRIRDYRNGESPLSELMFRRSHKLASRMVGDVLLSHSDET